MIPIYGRARPAWIGIFAVDAQQRQPPRSPGGLAFHTGALCSSFNALYLLSSPAPAGKHKKEETHMKRTKHSILNTRSLVMMAALVAIQIVLARYLSIQSEVFRVSFETIPLALAGLWLGPTAGVIVALVSDLLGTVISGIGLYFPPLSLGPMVFGFLCGISARYVFRSSMSETKDAWKVLTTVILAGIINSFVVGVLTFTWYQVAVMGTEGAFWGLAAANFLSRLATKPVTIVASALVVFLVNRAAYRPVVSRIVPRPQA